MMSDVLIDVVEALRQSGVDDVRTVALEQDGVDAVVDVLVDGRSSRLAIEYKLRAPYPNEVHRFDGHRERLMRVGRPVFAAPYITESLGVALRERGWSWVDELGNVDLRADGLILRQRTAGPPPRPRASRLPRGAGSTAIIRELIEQRGWETGGFVTRLAAAAHVTQPRVSQVLRQLSDLGLAARASDSRWRVTDRGALLDRFLDEYEGPRGSERYCYSLDRPLEVAVRASALSKERYPVVVSADVGPDRLRSWRVPDKLVVYTQADIGPRDLDAAPVEDRHAANVILRSPQDRSVFPRAALSVALDGPYKGSSLWLADPVQMVWDLIDLGGDDRAEAAEELKRWIIDQP